LGWGAFSEDFEEELKSLFLIFPRNEWGGGVEKRERRVESSKWEKTGWKRT
jgi:hypothetical protein